MSICQALSDSGLSRFLAGKLCQVRLSATNFRLGSRSFMIHRLSLSVVRSDLFLASYSVFLMSSRFHGAALTCGNLLGDMNSFCRDVGEPAFTALRTLKVHRLYFLRLCVLCPAHRTHYIQLHWFSPLLFSSLETSVA